MGAFAPRVPQDAFLCTDLIQLQHGCSSQALHFADIPRFRLVILPSVHLVRIVAIGLHPWQLTILFARQSCLPYGSRCVRLILLSPVRTNPL